MLLDLSNVLSEQHKSVDKNVSISMDEFRLRGKTYPVLSKDELHIQVEYAGDQKLRVSGLTNLTIGIPCDRCLEEVPLISNWILQEKLRQKKQKSLRMKRIN